MSRNERDEANVQRGVVDRISDGWAVILVGDEEDEHRLRENDLPEGVSEGSVVRVRFDGSDIEIVEVADDETDEKREEMRGRLSRLKKTRSTGRFN